MKFLKPMVIVAMIVLAPVFPAQAAQTKSAPAQAAPANSDQAQYIRKVVQAEQTGDFKLLLDACEEALKSGQLDWAHQLYVYQNRAMAHYVQHRFDLAAADFGRIIAKSERVKAYYSLNADEQIYKILRQMLTAAYLMRSIIYEQQGNYQLALNDLENYFKVSQVDPDKNDLERRRNLKKKLGQLK